MTTVRLVEPGGNTYGYDTIFAVHKPHLLVAYPYLGRFLSSPYRQHVSSWSLDSGAFTAYTLGVEIDRDAYHETALQLLAEDPKLVEVFALDVIGDHHASLVNAEAAWAAGVPGIPTYHVGEPRDALLTMARDYPKIALGGVAAHARKLEWAQHCFGLIWPKPVHGLGYGSPRSILAIPFHSVDASNWVTRPGRFGIWDHMGAPGETGTKLSVRGPKHGMFEGVVAWHARLESDARRRWVKEMAVLNQMLTEANWRGVAPCPTPIPSPSASCSTPSAKPSTLTKKSKAK